MANKNFEVKHGLSVGGTERITSAGVGTFTDLNVTGTTTTIDTATLQVQDKNIVINYGSGDTSSTASGAGITIQDAVDASNDATILWDASADEFDFSHTVTAPSLTIAGNAAFDTTTLVVDSSNNRVGIGTASPAQALTVQGRMVELNNSGIQVVSIQASSDHGQIVLNNSSGVAKTLIHSQGDSYFTGGNIGIGLTSPSASLDIFSSDASIATFTRDLSTDVSLNVSADNDGSILATGGVHALRIFTNSSEQVRLDSSGRLGIGTTSPAVSLDVGSKTDAIRVPNGTTAQRPTAALGQLRYNTTTSEFEGYAAGAWGKIGGGGDSFGTIAVSGQSNVVADQENDTLTLVAGAGIVLTTAAGSDTVTISGGSGSVFTTDLFTASGSGSALLEYTLSTTPSSENELIVFIEGVYQNKNSYALSGTTLTFDSGIVSGQEIVVHHVGAGVVGVTPIIDTFTGNGSTTAYTLSVAPPSENYLAVFWDGVYQHHSEYSVSGTTLTFTAAVPSSTAVEVYIPSVNGIGTPSDATVTPAKLSTGGPSWDTNSNQIVGSHYVRSDSTSMSTTSATTVATHAVATFRSVNYKVQITQGTNYHTSEVNVIHDGSTADITEYGTLFTGSSLGSLTAAISSGNLLLQFTPGSSASCTVKVMSTATTV